LIDHNLDREPIEPQKNIVVPSANYDDEMDEDDYNLTPPKGLLPKIAFYTFFPIHMILFFLIPNFTKSSNQEKVMLSLGVLLGIQTAVIYLISYFINTVMFGWNIQTEPFGICVNSIGFSLSFVVYNLQLSKHDKEVSFFTTFQMIGTYKWGFGAAFPWMIYFIAGNNNLGNNTYGFQAIIIEYTAIFMVLFVWVAINKARVLKKMYKFFLGAYLIFYICGAILPATMNNEI